MTMQRYIQEVSWENSPWSEEVLGSKKIIPGFNGRFSSKSWTERSQITPQSCQLAVEHINEAHRMLPIAVRRKITKADAEEVF